MPGNLLRVINSKHYMAQCFQYVDKQYIKDNPCTPLQKAFLSGPEQGFQSSYVSEKAIVKAEIKRFQRCLKDEKRIPLEPNFAQLAHSLTLNSQHGASVWLNTLPLKKHNCWLHKGDFRDALCLSYN